MDLKITGAKLSGDAEKDVKILANHVFQLEEQLRYQLRNLDVTNFNDLGLARYENGRLQVYAKQVEIQTEKLRLEFGEETDEIRAQFEVTVDGFKATVEGYGNDVKGYGEQVDGYARQVSSFEQTVGGFSATVEGYGNDVKEYGSQVDGYARQVSSFNQTVNGFNTTVKSYEQKVAGYTQQVSSFEQTANKISAVVSAVDDSSGNVTAASIVAAINNAGSTVKISADHVNIEGNFVTVSDLAGTGKVEINAGNIKAGGVIEGVQVKTAAHKYHGQVYLCENFIQFIGADSDDSSLIINDYGVLTLRSNTVEIEATSPDTPYIKILVDGGYWVISADKIYYVNSFGDVVREANMIEHY